MHLISIDLDGQPNQTQTAPGDTAYETGILGVAVHPKVIDGEDHTVVQIMVDDDRPGVDRSLLDCPMVAEVRTPVGDVITRELFDHDEFRRALDAERRAGGDDLRGVLLRTGGRLPPAYLRLGFLAVALSDTEGCSLVVSRFGRDELLEAVDAGRVDGSLAAGEHRSLTTMIDQRHPDRGRSDSSPP
ncbi:MAG: hypothetical protein OSA99_00015 [Acidimicrobiales bacterium]|nr:hypothetical protein [Acidimicrobiales bacterium]